MIFSLANYLRRRTSAGLGSALAALVMIASASGSASAQNIKVEVLPFTGPQAAKAQAEVMRALKKTCDFVVQSEWDETAKRLFATSHSADDVAAVAHDLNVQVVVTGVVKHEGAYMLSVSVRNGVTGKSAEKLRYSLKGPRMDAATLAQLAIDIPPAVDRTAALALAPPDATATNPDGTKPSPGNEDENPLVKKKEEKKEAPGIARPDWSPFVDASIGMIIGARYFSIGSNGGGPLTFQNGVGAGLHLDVTGYPLALLADRPGDVINGITGLGLGLSLDYPFWPATALVPMGQMAGPTMYATHEYRLEAGLRYHWNFLNKPLRPELLVNFQYGIHSFTVAKEAGGSDVGGLPDVEYSYLAIGLGLHVPFTSWIGALVNFNFNGLLSAGPVQTAAEYGSGGGSGLRLNLGLVARPWKGLTLAVTGYYERFSLSFNQNTTPPPAKIATGATDQYYGAVITIGYVY